jgi:AraC-like DNA-binding protein
VKADNDMVLRVIEYILNLNITELSELTVNKIASKFDVNTCFLSRKFKKSTNFLLSNYINFIRIQQAQKLLKTRSDLTISQISQIIGIRKSQHFREKFKKIYGINPNQYRILKQK